jgi:hypothetical protein
MLGLNYGQVVPFAGQKWRPNFEVNYDFRDTTGNAQWVVRLGVALLVPSLRTLASVLARVETRGVSSMRTLA